MQKDLTNNHAVKNNHYDYIISGAGCAGLSLLLRLLQSPALQEKKILVIDQDHKINNDRTWCFWEKETGFFENIVHHRWLQLQFKSENYSSQFSIEPYHYKMIRGIDLYEYAFALAKQFPNVEIKIEKVIDLHSDDHQAIVKTENNIYTTDYAFNSILFKKLTPTKNKYLLLQHFKGWMIETEKPCFDPAVATFMDFTVDQTRGTTFMYILPVSENKALVEYTMFTENILSSEEYDVELRKYILQKLKINEYKILHEEFGIIPMTNQKFVTNNGRIINIGTAGEQTKASSGFTFQFIQKQSDKVIDSLLKNKWPIQSKGFNEKKFRFYDSVLLNILVNKKMSGAKIFARIFQNSSSEAILKFLDNESDLLDDLEIIYSLPIKKFFIAAVQEISK